MINNLFLSVGAMKAGTTWLYEHLRNHPDIHFTPEKEIHYFANKVGIENQLSYRNRLLKLKEIMHRCHNGNAKFIANNIYDIAWYANYANKEIIDNEWYVSLFDDVDVNKYCADFSNLYCQMSDNGWENVKKISHNTKVIYTLRDPMKRLWSHYKFHHKWVGKEDNVLDDGIELFKETLSKPWFYKNMDYAGNLEKVIHGIGEENVLVLYFEDFRINPAVEAKKIADFLNISPIEIEASSSSKKVNSTKDYEMPAEWESLAIEALRPFIVKMNTKNIKHVQWSKFK